MEGPPAQAGAGSDSPSSFHKTKAAERAELARGLRGLMGKSQALCRNRRTQAEVQLCEYRSRTDGALRLTINNVSTCKSPLCPQCAPKIMDVRAEEIRSAITTHGARRTYFLSLTIRHRSTQSIALQHKLLTYSFGRFFSGRKGQELARRLGGPLVAPPGVRKAQPVNLHRLITPTKKWIHQKPHSIRSHDRTWSREHGFHLHLHCLLFLHQEVDEKKVLWLVRRRWRVCLRQTLKTFKQLCRRTMREGEAMRDRVSKVFGSQLFTRAESFRTKLKEPRPLEWVMKKKYPRESTRRIRSLIRKGNVMLGAAVCSDGRALVQPYQLITVCSTIQECAKRVLRKLKSFTQELAEIDRDPFEQEPGKDGKVRRSRAFGHGVHVEQVRHARRIPRYLVKLGCELSGMYNKLGRVSDDGITHYGLWELANIAVDRNHPVNAAARGAWRALYRATFGTQTITWSQDARGAFGLDDERPDQSIEQEAPKLDEETRLLGIIKGAAFDQKVREQQQGFIAQLYRAHAAGALDPKLGPLPKSVAEYFEPAEGIASMFRAVEPKPIEYRPEWWQEWQNEARGAARGRAPPKPPPDWTPPTMEDFELAREELIHKLHDLGVAGPRSTPEARFRPPPEDEEEGAA